MKKLIFGIIFVFCVAIIGVFAKSMFFGGKTVVVDLSNYENFSLVSLTLDNEPVLTPNEDEKTYTILNWSGSRELVIKSPMHQEISITESYRSKGTETITPQPETVQAKNIVDEFDDGYERQIYSVTDAEFLSPGWIGYQLTNVETETTVLMLADYDKKMSFWRSTTYGGEYELEVLIDDIDIPNNVLDYIFR